MNCDHPPEEIRLKIFINDINYGMARGDFSVFENEVNEFITGKDVESHEIIDGKLWVWYRFIPQKAETDNEKSPVVM